ncbi:hypothetical protein HPB47_026579 [Ixodes persulcatus]|uniref:Uncharacterized protein n=1 Tax=Ixodes persulcatus TaxID=34615 RepID=A0AC60Q088_IXOPE|nr:hypothetical protein HPB47_026579 [Ixodes persulcatus]
MSNINAFLIFLPRYSEPLVQALVFRKCSIALKLNNEDGKPAPAPAREVVKEAQVFIIQHALKASAHHEPGLKVSP